jgi:hypothetical protein
MARFQGAKEKLHLPIYDAFFVPGAKNTNTTQAKKFEEMMTDPRVIRFFVDVQNKTRLETNLQAAGVLPSLNTFEARAMRVVTSMPQVVVDRNQILPAVDAYCSVLNQKSPAASEPEKRIAQDNLIAAIRTECDRGCVAASLILPELIYNSVTTLLVGEKIMIEMPTYWFPSGAGVSPGNGTVTNHGEPDPMATFRFAEPVFIEPQQNFRVEMLFPQGVPEAVKNALGPLRIWVVLDGYLTRDVQ